MKIDSDRKSDLAGIKHKLPGNGWRKSDLANSFADSLLPRFAERILNVTVTVGRDALLACVVDNLRGFKVSH